MESWEQNIPSDWQKVTLADLGGKVTSGSRGWARYYADHGSLFLRITNLERNDTNLNLRDKRFVQVDPNDPEALRTRLIPGDILISITADIGIIGHVGNQVPKLTYINQHIARVRLDPRLADTRFIAYYLSSWGPQRRFVGATDQGAKAGMNLATVARLPVAAPPLAEQSRIADALEEIDELIVTLERAIAKQRAFRQGLMQHLLTGRTRLRRFSDEQEWRTLRLGDVVTLQRGFDLPTRLRRPGTTPVVSSSGVSGLHDHAMVSAPGVVTGRYGTIGEVFLQRKPFWPLNTTLWVSNFHGNDEVFIYYLLQTIDFKTHSGKSGVPGVNRNDLHSEMVSIPADVTEQRAISAALTDADNSISIFERSIFKTRAIKQGMMQQLLTGRTRLPV